MHVPVDSVPVTFALCRARVEGSRARLIPMDQVKRISVSATRLATTLLLLAFVNCKGEQTEPAVATTLSANSSTSVAGVAGAVVTPPPSVIVKDQRGSPMAGVTVTFAVVSGGGSISGATVISDASGVATVGSWTLGTAAGANVVTATSGSLASVSFTATSTAGPPASLARNAGDNQTAAAGSTVPVPPSVLVKDANGNPAPGVSVTFAVAAGGGSLTGATALTDAAGIAAVGSWTLGTVVGANTLNATSGSLPGVSFTATSIAGAAASLAKTAGDNQTAAAGSAIPISPSVVVKDANGNPVAGISVTFAVISGGGSLTGATAVSNAAGIATVGSWTLGAAAGSNSLTATSGSLTSVSFTATATAGAAASLTRNGGDGQTAVAGSAVPVPPSVLVKDANGNPTQGVTVTFTVASGGGSVTGAAAVTNAVGIATIGSWTLGPIVGANALNATTGSLAGVSFTATSTAGPAATLVKNTGDNQAGIVGGTVSIPPAVLVRDANGNAKSGVSVTFAVASGGGSITGASAVTNSSGVAAVGSWTLGNSIGGNSLSASVTGLPSIAFTASAISAVCGVRATHAFGTSSSGTLSLDDCQLPDGSFIDFYTTSVSQAGAYFFRESAAFDTYLLLSMPDGTTVAENDDELDTGTNSGIKALLPAGSYLLGAGTFAPNITGAYTISSTTAPTDVANCEHVFVVKGITTAQNISTTDCNLAGPGGTPIYSDGYLIFVSAGTSVTITMSSPIVDSFLQLVTLDGALIAQNDNIDSSTTNARISFTATQSGYYAIFARTVPTTTLGPYTLTIQ
jgi:adhesin/invasin